MTASGKLHRESRRRAEIGRFGSGPLSRNPERNMEVKEALFGANQPSIVEDFSPPPAPLPFSEPAPEPVAETVAPPADVPAMFQPGGAGHPDTPAVQPTPVPIGALLDEREKRQAVQAERDALKARVAEYERAKEAPKVPDMFADPDGFAAYNQRQIAETEARVTQRISGVIAVQAYGEETVKAAEAWANQNPAVLAEAMKTAHPYDYAVKAYQKHQDIAALGGKTLAEYVAEQVARHGITSAPAAAPVAAPAPFASNPAAPPRSIATAPSAVGPKTGYERSKVVSRLLGP